LTALSDTTVAIAPPTHQRLLIGDDASIAAHTWRYGPLPQVPGDLIQRMVKDAGLTGRGGAGFPTYRKVEAVAAGRDPVVVANGAEGEPASSKDRVLLRYGPHLVLDGLVLAARAVGAAETHVYVPVEAAADVHAALADRRDPITITVHVATDAFIAGEESAVVSAVNGGLPAPRDKIVRVVDQGVGGRPTLVQNVETLAHLALIVRYGPDWFRTQGTTAEPGTFLATVSGVVADPGVCEMPYGVRIGDLIDATGGATEPVQALLVGGYHGGWIPPDPDIAFSRAGLERYGATPGAGIVFVLAADECGLATTAHLLGYLAGQTAGQCGPCFNGLPRMADTFASLAELGTPPSLAGEVERLARLVTGRGACKHPDGTVRLARSGLGMFGSEIAAHRAGWCTARSGGRR